MTNKRAAAEIAFVQGFAVAVAEVARNHDNPTMAADLIAGSGFDLRDFRQCDSYDLKVIRKLFREESVLSLDSR